MGPPTHRRLFLHIGLPKTGTTYLQQILWSGKDQLAKDGLLLPGSGHREHLWAALDLQERKNLARRDPRAVGAWARLVDQVRRARGDSLITHEFFCGASAAQAAAARDAVEGAEVHVIVTARDAAGMLTAGWQESVKNGGTRTLAELAVGKRGGAPEFSWRTWNLRGVLNRWTRGLAAHQVHVLPVPDRSAPPDQHWRNFASVLGVDPSGYALPEGAMNTTLGVTQIELLRRVNAGLVDFRSPLDRGEWIRGYLAEGRLSRRPGPRPALGEVELADCRRRDRRAAELIDSRGFQVVGDRARLRASGNPPGARQPSEVTDGELVEAAADLIADMLADIRAASSAEGRAAGRGR